MPDDQPLPDAPDDLPGYVAGPVARQSPERLRALSAWAATLADAKERDAEQDAAEPPHVGEQSDGLATEQVDASELPTVPASDETTVYVHAMSIDCGPGCGGCPHGPYLYGKYRSGDTVETVYLENSPIPDHAIPTRDE